MGRKTVLTLMSGPLEVQLAPSVGGAIRRFDYVRGAEIIPVLRGFSGDGGTVLDHASFPLVPYCNRIRDGRFSFRGKVATLLRNMKGDSSPLHGDGWLNSWGVVRHDGPEAELLFRYEAGDWPWTYEARQLFSLSATGLSLRLTCRNFSDEPMPCGLGFHPYFPCGPETRIDTDVAEVWTVDEKVLPVERLTASGRYDLRDRPICGQELDNGFGGWGGRMTLETPGIPFVTGMSSPDARFFQLYSPASGGYIAAEPVTHANAALNEPEESWQELGLRVLAPGEETALNAWIGLAGDHFSARLKRRGQTVAGGEQIPPLGE